MNISPLNKRGQKEKLLHFPRKKFLPFKSIVVSPLLIFPLTKGGEIFLFLISPLLWEGGARGGRGHDTFRRGKLVSRKILPLPFYFPFLGKDTCF